MARTALTSPSGHVIRVPEESVDYWQALGYAAEKAPTKKAASSKSSKTSN